MSVPIVISVLSHYLIVSISPSFSFCFFGDVVEVTVNPS